MVFSFYATLLYLLIQVILYVNAAIFWIADSGPSIVYDLAFNESCNRCVSDYQRCKDFYKWSILESFQLLAKISEESKLSGPEALLGVQTWTQREGFYTSMTMETEVI